MTTEYVRTVVLGPDLPEMGTGPHGKPVKLADVERVYPKPGDRANVYYLSPADGRQKVYPWRDLGYAVVDGVPIASVGDTEGPWISRDELASLGLTDESLAALRDRLGLDASPLAGLPDVLNTQARRHELYTEAMDRAYA